jgi:hypothetical protein
MAQDAFAERGRLTPDKLSKSLKGVRRFTSLDLVLITEVSGKTVNWLLTPLEPLRPPWAEQRRGRELPGTASASGLFRSSSASNSDTSGRPHALNGALANKA